MVAADVVAIVAIVAVVVVVADLAGKFAQSPKTLFHQIANGRQRAVRGTLARVTRLDLQSSIVGTRQVQLSSRQLFLDEFLHFNFQARVRQDFAQRDRG